METFIAIAIPKKVMLNGQLVDHPELGPFYALFDQTARAAFPHLFPNGGGCTHRNFAWKIQDGDGADNSGKSVADKPGFAGHWIFKMATQYAVRCYPNGKYTPADMFPEPDKVFKRGHFIRVSGTIDGNGVEPNNAQAVPGLYVSPSLVEWVGYGEEIVSGPNAAEAFAAPIGIVPTGMSSVPLAAAPSASHPATPGNLAPPALPGTGLALPGAAAPPTLPGLALPGAAAPAGLGAPPLPGAGLGPPPIAAGPAYIMQPSAQGATREQLNAQGWTDQMLIDHGHMKIS